MCFCQFLEIIPKCKLKHLEIVRKFKVQKQLSKIRTRINFALHGSKCMNFLFGILLAITIFIRAENSNGSKCLTLLPFNLLCSINFERTKGPCNFFFHLFQVVKRKGRTIILYNVTVVLEPMKLLLFFFWWWKVSGGIICRKPLFRWT